MSKAKRTKWYIIEKTAEIFNKKGFAGTSLSELTSATGLTKGSIYGNFENKEDVAIAAFNHNYQILIKRFAAKLSEKENSIDKLMIFLDTYEEIYEDIISMGGCPILNNTVDADDTNSRLNSLSKKAFEAWNKNIKGIILHGKEKKEIYVAIDASYYANIFIITIEGGLLLAKSTGDKAYFTDAIQHLREIVMDRF